MRTSFDESKEEALRKALAQHAEADVNPAPAASMRCCRIAIGATRTSPEDDDH